MKISKNKVIKSCDTNPYTSIEPQDSLDEQANVVNPKDNAVFHIKAAIDELAKIANEDEIAHDGIADLSVVLFSLK